jgi:hypothetical protein
MVDNHEFASKHDIMKAIADEYCSSCKEDEIEDCQIGCDAYLRDIKELIRRIPAADVVEVVRCKDCKHCNYLFGKSPLCLGGAAWKPIKENDYCAWGERRANNERIV